ncbi:MAG: tRNA (guanosine(46)-N7)-methyltransferase TrmB [Gammaproteobacteria bacterium]|nr:tRNA (guanosine(46)-N7)-methyltransferase TrmB [Gammaproteobacteria bacterium]MBT4494726.1 tRNA (guanosine(46)-N7)-methyltransferase TrmB [Gammaproteobacteria bacterium]MBT7372247.1 tRNA (guanosine(46)-N7)-methyltransferase TrmB [Gammaproteobacteria bacterium]
MTPGQERAIDSGWPDYGLDVATGEIDLGIVFGRCAPLTLEIGFGMGESLFQQAHENPDRDFVGIEVHRPGVGHLLMRIHEADIANIRLYAEDSIDVLRNAIPERSLDVVQLFFPDPWPKKRHHKRRIVNRDFVELVSSRLVSRGILHIATDWEPYAADIEILLSSREDLVQIEPPPRPRTKFEQRGERLGHRITDLAYRLAAEAH